MKTITETPDPDEPPAVTMHPADTATHADAEAAELDQLLRQALLAMDSLEENLEAVTSTADANSAIRSDAASEPDQLPAAAQSSTTNQPSPGNGQTRISPRQVIEAALFVGGTDLTTRKLGRLLQDEFDAEQITRCIDELNELYVSQRRPYEVRFGEGGYRIVLKSEFEKVRGRVFGIGPREIRLSQEALEMLSLVAYRQPLTPQDVDAAGRKNATALLRQLVRRELVAVERDAEDSKLVSYTTTPRFLELFGLASLDELPQTDELNFK